MAESSSIGITKQSVVHPPRRRSPMPLTLVRKTRESLFENFDTVGESILGGVNILSHSMEPE